MAQVPASNVVQPHPDQAAALQKLHIWVKLAKGELHTITKRDVEELFSVLDTEERGEISRDDLLVLRQIPELSLSSEDIEILVNDADKDRSGKVSPEELFKALTQGEITYNVVLASLGQKKAALKTTECDKEDLIEFLRFEYETKSALWSLPQTMLLFIAFVVSMTLHFDMTTGFTMQNALLGEIEGEGSPYLRKYVHDVPTFWDWMESSFITSHFKSGPTDLEIWPYPGRVASYNQIIGGVRLLRTTSLPGFCKQSADLRTFYDTRFHGRCHKQEDTQTDSVLLSYHERQEDLVQQIQGLRFSTVTNRSWVDQNTTSVDVGILFYNAHLQAFTAHHLDFLFKHDGEVMIKFRMETFLADPYANILVLIPDIIFGIILLRMFYSEMLELVPALSSGLDGFQQYMEFWNVVDWFAIFVGTAVMFLWGIFTTRVGSVLQGKIRDLDMVALDNAVFANHTYITPFQSETVMPRAVLLEKMERLHSVMDEVAALHRVARLIAFLYIFVLMMKFFKAFQANPRLNIVIKTIQTSATDIIHFLIVFFFIFFVFCSAAYVYFGSKIKGFSTIPRSTMMCWRILMGEFDMEAMEAVQSDWAYIWTFIFQFLVLLILLNMLLAIIMDTYAAVNAPGAETIWSQIQDALNVARETRGHLDLWYLICEFENEDYQVHPRDRVTSKSLRTAFESKKMTKHNADYLIRKTAEFVKAKEAKTELKMSDAVRIISRMQTTTLRTMEAADQIVEMMREDRRRPQEERFDAIIAGVDPDTLQHSKGRHNNSSSANLPGVVPGSGSQVSNGKQAVGNGPLNGTMGNTVGHANSMGGTNNMSQVQALQQAAQARRQSHISMMESRRTSLMSMTNQISFRPQNSAGGGAMSGVDQQMLAHLEHMQTTLDGIRSDQLRIEVALFEELRDMRVYIEQRDTWLEQRLNAMDRRFEKVERSSDRVSGSLQGFDFSDLMATTDRIAHFLQLKSKGLAGSVQGKMASTASYSTCPEEEVERVISQTGSSDVEEVGGGPGLREAGHAEAEAPFLSGNMSLAQRKRMGHQLDLLMEKTQQLLNHAEESSETRRLLWKIDVNLRQTRVDFQAMQQKIEGLRATPAPASPARGDGSRLMAPRLDSSLKSSAASSVDVNSIGGGPTGQHGA